jgi:hypothetical protein
LLIETPAEFAITEKEEGVKNKMGVLLPNICCQQCLSLE